MGGYKSLSRTCYTLVSMATLVEYSVAHAVRSIFFAQNLFSTYILFLDFTCGEFLVKNIYRVICGVLFFSKNVQVIEGQISDFFLAEINVSQSVQPCAPQVWSY